MIKLGKEQHLGYKAFILFVIRRMLAGIILLAVVLAIVIFANNLSAIVRNIVSLTNVSKENVSGVASTVLIYISIVIFWLGALGCFFGILIACLEYMNLTFTFNEFDIIMKKGILDRKENSIPYRQIQDVNLDRPLIYQVFGLSKLVLRTSGTEEKNEHGLTEINISPIEKNLAEEIQQMLERKIGVQVVEDEVKADKEK